MRVPLSWLRDYVEVDLTPEQLAERLTLLGMEVRGIERWGADWEHVVIGELLTVAPHPRADRLSLTTVTLGSGEPVEIVCGATNIAPGQRVPVALPGAILPGNRRIERAEKMGVVSNGMLCSGDELRLTSDADGILILSPDAPLGMPLSDFYGDTVLDVDVKPNRGDALSLIGLAREVSAATGAPVRWPDLDLVEEGRPTADRLGVEVMEPRLCTRFVGRWVADVRVGPSPERIQMRLLAAGMRPVSNVVDASNVVMLEMGKPIHTFDGAAVTNGRILVRLARSGERLETLDHVNRELDPETLLIADPAGPLAIAGIMGGASSEVSASTRDVAIESAIFDPVSIRRTGQRYALRSEASLRFEKGQEHRLARIGADRTAQLVAAWAGGRIAPGRLDTAPDEPPPGRVHFRPRRVNRLLGTAFTTVEQRALLDRVGIASEPVPASSASIVVAAGPRPLTVPAIETETLAAIVPTWRRDLHIESDVAEEIARVRGYEVVQGSLPQAATPPYHPNPLAVREAVRDVLAGAGLTEVVTHALVAPEDVERFVPLEDPDVPPGETWAGGPVVTVTNPLSRDHSVLRQSLLGSLVRVVGANLRHGRADIAIFEVGRGYARSEETGREWVRLGIALCGAAAPPHWADQARPRDLDDAKGAIELLGVHLGFGPASYEPLTTDPNLHPGRAARIRLDSVDGASAMTGRVGEVHPAVLEALELRTDRVVVAELAIAGLSAGTPRRIRAAAPPRYQAVERDLALVVSETMPAATLAAAIRDAAGSLLASLRLFDIYRGAPLGPDERSMAYRLQLQAVDRTLTDPEVDAVIDAVVAQLERLGGRRRE